MRCKLGTAALLLSTAVHATVLQPERSVDLRTFVALRETVAAAAAWQGKLYLLVTDRAPTGRSAILVEAGLRDGATLWRDVGTPADDLAVARNHLVASAPMPNGLRILRLGGNTVQPLDVAGATAAMSGSDGQLVRLLSSGELAIHDATSLSSFERVIPSVDLKGSDTSLSCGPGPGIPRGPYLVFQLPSDRIALAERTTAQLHIFARRTGRLEWSVVLTHPDIVESRTRNAAYFRKVVAGGGNAAVALISAGASHTCGDFFLLLAPFHPSEGARIVRVNPQGQVTFSYRCMYPGFNPEDGPPGFLTVHDGTLYLVSARGKVMTFRIG